jgi:hypothetical protein
VAGTHRLGIANTTPSEGLGGFASPLVCQTLIAQGVPWRNFYLGSLIVSTLNMCFLTYTFRPTRKEFESDLRLARQFLDTTQPHLGLCNDLPVVGGTKSSSSSITWVEGPTPGKSAFFSFLSCLSSYLTSTSPQADSIDALPMDTFCLCMDSQWKVRRFPDIVLNSCRNSLILPQRNDNTRICEWRHSYLEGSSR